MGASNAVDRQRRSLFLGLLGLLTLATLGPGCGKGGLGFDPELLTARVAIRPEGEELARVGRVELAAGRGFTLHAVVEAKTFRGRTIYYTEAPALEIHGRPVPAESLRLWSGAQRARVLWFTVEGSPPYAESDEIAFREVFRADWPLSWTVTGDLEPAVENYLPGNRGATRGVRFGTQRFMVRVEILGRESEILPRQSLTSDGAAELPDGAERFSTVVAELPGSLAQLSRVFILPQREPSGPERDVAQRRIAEWLRRDLAFSRLTLLRSWIDSVEMSWKDLPWQAVDLEGASDWGRRGRRCGSASVSSGCWRIAVWWGSSIATTSVWTSSRGREF